MSDEKSTKEIKFDNDQMAELLRGREAGVNVALYANPAFLAVQMHEIRLGLEKNIDVSKYANPQYDWFQMEEIRKGLQSNVNVDLYAKPDIDYRKMRQIREGLEQGINLSLYVGLSAGIIEEIRKSLLQNVKIVKYINDGYDIEQLKAIRHALVKNIDIDPYLKPELRGVAIEEIIKAIEMGLPAKELCNDEYNWQQMREIRIGMQERLDYHLYICPLYSYRQMREIRLGLEEALDVNVYKTLMYDQRTMRIKREQMLADRDNKASRNTERVKLPQGMAIGFENNDLKAYLYVTFISDKLPSQEEFIRILNDNGVREGIDEKTVKAFVNGEITDNKILIASGKNPTTGDDGYYEYGFDTNANSEQYIKSENTIDYNAIKFNSFVKKGDKLAVYHGAVMGEDGYRVTGEVIKAKRGSEKEALKGKGFYLSDDRNVYYAAYDGIAELVDGEVRVVPYLKLKEVTKVTGDVDFDGCVHVTGSVGGDVCVKATGDIIIDNTLLGGRLYSGRNILIRKGINGGVDCERGFVECKGTLASGYIESAIVSAGENVYSNGCMHADISVGSKIYIGGKVVGGCLSAIDRIEAESIGNDVGINTKVIIKVKEKDEDEIRKLNSEMDEAKKQLKVFAESYENYKSMYAAEVRNSMPVFLKLEDAIYTKKKDIDELQKIKAEIEVLYTRVNRASIKVSGYIYEGTFVQIAEAKMESPTIKGVQLSKEGKKIRVL